MKTTRLFFVLVVLVLSLVLVTATLAAANTTQAVIAADGGMDVQSAVMLPDYSTVPIAASEGASAPPGAVSASPAALPEPPAPAAGPPEPYDGIPEGVLDSRQPFAEASYGLPPYIGSGAPAQVTEAGRNGPLAPPVPGPSDLVVCLDSEQVWGTIGSEETATVTVNGAQMGAALSDDNGFFWTTLYDGNGDRPGLGAGDQVVIYNNGAQAASATLRSIDAEVDTVANTVSGTIGGVGGFPLNVTVYVGGGVEPSMTSYSKTVPTDGSGHFNVDFSDTWDILIWEEPVVAYAEGGLQVHQHFTGGESLLVRPWPWNQVMGYAEPASEVTATLYLSNFAVKASEKFGSEGNGWYYWEVPDDVLETDIVEVEFEGGNVLSRTVDLLSISVDYVNDRLTGEALSGATVRGLVGSWTPLGWRDFMTSTTASSPYTLEFGSLIDFMPNTWGGVFVADAEGDELNLWNFGPYVEVNQTWDEVFGRGPAGFGPNSEGRTVTLTLSSTSTQYMTEMDYSGWYQLYPEEFNLPDIGVGEIVTVEARDYSWQGVVQVQTMTVQADTGNNQFTGEIEPPSNRVEFDGAHWQYGYYPIGGDFGTYTDASSPFAVSLVGFDLRDNDSYNVIHRTAEENAERISGHTDFMRVWLRYNGVIAHFGPGGTAYTLTLRDGDGNVKDQVMGVSDGPIGDVGYIQFNTSVDPGDRVTGQSSAGYSQTVSIPNLYLGFDMDAETVVGHGPPNALLIMNIYDQGDGCIPTDQNGDFVVGVDQLQDFYGDGDIEWGAGGYICSTDGNGNNVCVWGGYPAMIAVYDMYGGRNMVWGRDANPGSTVYLTVTHPVSGVIATADTTAGSCDWCGYGGFSVDFPDGTIVPSNTVTANYGAGLVNDLEVVAITGYPDPDTEIVTGTAPANGTVYGWVEHHWGDQHDYGETEIDANGVYTMAYGDQGWGIEYGDTFHVYYYAPYGNEVEYVFWLPAPELQIEKGHSSGHAIPGGTYLYWMRYRNQGNGSALNTIITDTLPVSTSYAGDTSGFPLQDGGGVLTWTLDEVPPDTDAEFYVALNIHGDVLTQTNLTDNCAHISTSSPGDYDPGNNEACVGDVWVDGGEAGLWVDKWPYPSDPHPGQEFLYEIQYGSEGGGATGPAWLTDTLPVSTTFVSWYEDSGWGALWTEVVTTGGKFALYAPAGIPGDMGGRIYLRLLLDPDATISKTLHNHVVLTTTNDINPGSNEDDDYDAHVSPERYDLRLEKSYNGGVPVPGYWIEYFIWYENQGNVATQVRFTDTMPTGLSYDHAQWGGGQPGENEPLPDPQIYGNKLVWDLDTLGVGMSRWFHVYLNISDTLSAWDVITNCATIAPEGDEDTAGDNESCFSTILYPPGPNLRVSKEHEWHGQDNLGYRILVENIGTETIYGMWLTDTLPDNTSYNGWYNMDWGWERLVSETQSSDELRWQFDEFYSGDTNRLYFDVHLDDYNARPRWYTNTVELDVPPGDPTPGDNSFDDVVVLGEVEQVELWVANEGASMWGRAQPNVPITITTAYSQYFGWVRDDGNWDTNDDGWNAHNVEEIHPGDVFTVTAGAGNLPVVIYVPDPFTAEADSATNRVWGQIGNVDHEWVDVDVDDGGPHIEVQTDNNGNYEAVFDELWRGARGRVRYYTQFNYAEVWIRRHFSSPDLVIQVDYDHNWVYGDYEAGHTIWITVTDGMGGLKGTAEVTSGHDPDWNCDDCFVTHDEDWDTGSGIDIEPGDWVYALVNSDPYTTEVHVGEIDAGVDTVQDVVSGTIHAEWWDDELLTVRCEIHEEDGESIEIPDVDPDGGEFYCDFSGLYDIQPGHNVAVNYEEPDRDRVQAHPFNPTSSLRVEKWADGDPAEGGNFVYHIRYRNEGELSAAGTVMTDTMVGMTYITDTSGLPVSGSGSGPIVWDVGLLDPGDWIEFDYFVAITAASSDTITNAVQIETSNPFDQGDSKYAEWGNHVRDNVTELGVNKNAWTGDPAAGEVFVWEVNVCNNSDTASTQVTMTDTLPLSTTLLTWWAQHPGWQFEYEGPDPGTGDDILVISRPSLPSWFCSYVYLLFEVDSEAWPGMPLTNTAIISASNDLNPNDNGTDQTINVSDPYTNTSTNKWWNWGRLVPGGELSYSIDVWNHGNTTVEDVYVVDGFPEDSSLIGVWAYDRDWNYLYEVSPEAQTEDWVKWKIDELIPGDGINFEIQLDIDGEAVPGTVLTNTVEVYLEEGDENNYDDNYASWTETLFDHGPNLRVRKEHEWHGDWDLGYQINLENIGDETVYDVWITDTLPDNTDYNWDWGMDWSWDRLISDTQSSDELRWQFDEFSPGDNNRLYFSVHLDDYNARPRWYTNTVEVDVPPGDPTPEDNRYEDVVVLVEVEQVDLWVASEGANMWGRAQPNVPITVTTAYSQYFGWVDGDGNWNIDSVEEIHPGDILTVTAGAGNLPVVVYVPDPFTAEADSATNRVWGQIDSVNHEGVDVDVYDGGPSMGVETDSSGNYEAVFGELWRGFRGEVRYYTEFDYAQVGFRRGYWSPDLIILVDYDNDYVYGEYEAGHTVWITVTDGMGGLKGTAEVTSGHDPDWGCDDCFVTHNEDWSTDSDSGVDIEPGDWVYGLVNSDPHTTEVHVGEIDAGVDTVQDVVSGTIHAEWWGDEDEMLLVRCEIHEENGEGIEIHDVDPDGGEFYCDFSGLYDIQPGHNVAVSYEEPDRDRVQAHPSNPTSSVRVEKWADGDPAEGGNFVYHIRYRNEGGLAAAGTVMTDTMVGMTYITDTSGLPVSGSGSGPIVWDLDTLDPGDWIEFDYFVAVTAASSNTITNAVQIETSNPFDQGDSKYAEWVTHVRDNVTQLNVGKNAWTGDPAAGEVFVWAVNVCNNSDTASTQVTMTDTLPVSTTLLTWWAQHPGWQFEYEGPDPGTGDEILVVSRPSLPSWWCSYVYLLFEVDSEAWNEMPLTNTANISASNDTSSGDDYAEQTVWVNDPHTNLSTNKWWAWGRLVPGGELTYHIDVWNNGNTTVNDIYLTDTLPVSSSLIGVWSYDRDWNFIEEVVPDDIGEDYVVWKIDQLIPGDGMNFEVQLDVDGDADPGTELINEIQVEMQPNEDSDDDNYASWTETLFDHGPNLRVRKDGQWDDWGEQTRRASYWVTVENVGDEPVKPVEITDVYDAKMYLDGGIGLNYGDWWNWGDDPGNHTFTVTLDHLGGGEGVGIDFGTMTDTWPLPFGLLFTNTVDVTVDPDDRNPDDNSAQVVLGTGPDLMVEKYLVDGKPLPGEEIVLGLRVRNEANIGYWNMQHNFWMTDTLPTGLEYISSTLSWCGWIGQEWCGYPPHVEDGNQISWQFWPFGPGEEYEIHLTVKISEDAQGGDIFINKVEVAASEPLTDTEAFLDNNESKYEVIVTYPVLEVSKDYESSRVAGTVVTYTLTVENSGNMEARDVDLEDVLPTPLTYLGGDGSFDGTMISWNFEAIPENGGTETGWFNATLPCAWSVTNDDYQATGNDPPIASDPGVAVTFSVKMPTIQVDLDYAPDDVVAGDTVYFTATAGTDGTGLSYAWNFEGPTRADGLTTSHVFATDGEYTVVFTATDTCGYYSTEEVTIKVQEPKLVASFDQSATSVVVGDTVYFTDTSTTDRPPIVAWLWDFGDQSPKDTTQDASHIYTTEGTFNVTLTVTDTLGYSDQAEGTVTVASGCIPLTDASFTYQPMMPVMGSVVNFTASITPSDATGPITYLWDFGDKSTGSGATPTHAYDSAGTYKASVTASSACTPVGVTSKVQEIEVMLHRIFLPLVVR